jgi:hypothetical protein
VTEPNARQDRTRRINAQIAAIRALIVGAAVRKRVGHLAQRIGRNGELLIGPNSPSNSAHRKNLKISLLKLGKVSR